MNEDQRLKSLPAEQSNDPLPTWHVYVLISLIHPNRTYAGLTHRPPTERLKEHNTGHSPYTSAHKPWRLVTFTTFTNQQKAHGFETYLKSGSGFRTLKRFFLD